MVTAKLKVSRITPLGAVNVEDAWGAEVEMTPDYANNDNAEWANATPSAVCRMTITNKEALETFKLNRSMTVQFVPDEDEG